LKNIKKILIIIQRSNGDVFLSLSLINALFDYYDSPLIDLLVNDDTAAVANLLPHINFIHTFSYKQKKDRRFLQEREIISSIYKKYDLSINLTASDRSVLYASLSASKTISAIESDNKKSWWKKIILSKYYYFDPSNHILQNNMEPLNLLKISHKLTLNAPEFSKAALTSVKDKLNKKGIIDFIIFHPSAQYDYKIYPQNLREELLHYLSTLGISILVTGSSNKIDMMIKKNLPSFPNVVDFIGETTIEEYLSLSNLALAYIGMDTLNMHIAASQNRRIFAIFGPTKLQMWSPWSNELGISATEDKSLQTYGKNTIFQADMPCVACGNAGCNDRKGRSECLYNIDPKDIFKSVENWFYNQSNIII
jgi:heptosyltransferase III